jgi:hypothetical protein
MSLLVVEDGTGIANANSYVDRDYVDAYHLEMGNTDWVMKSSTYESDPSESDLDGDRAMIRGARSLDRIFGNSWKGLQTFYGTQGLNWPRTGVDYEGNAIERNELPRELKHAQCEAALREKVSPGSLLPDLERGGAIRKVKAGSVEVVYESGAPSTTIFQPIELILSKLLFGDDELRLG